MELQVTFEVIDPGCCGQPMALPAQRLEHLRNSHDSFWCPNCGSCRTYTGVPSKMQRLEGRLKEAEHLRAGAEMRADREVRSHSATRGHLTRQKKRAAAGTCACCNRTFKNVARHMKSQHPDFVEGTR